MNNQYIEDICGSIQDAAESALAEMHRFQKQSAAQVEWLQMLYTTMTAMARFNVLVKELTP